MQVKLSILSLFILIFIFTACKNEEVVYLQTIAASNNPAIIKLDTFAGKFSVYRPDSIATGNLTSNFIGYHNDPIFGKIKCESYLRITTPTTLSDIDDNAAYDSMALIIQLDSSYYGDTLSPINIAAYRLSETIENSTNTFYNTSRFTTYSSPLGSIKKVCRPLSGDSVRIKIDDVLGTQFFNFFKTNASEVTDATVFLDFFKGIKLQTDLASTNVIYGFKNTAYALRMYYHTDVGRIVKHYADFTPLDKVRNFYSVSANRSGTILAPLDTQSEVDASLLGNNLYLQDLTGIETRIKYPSISNLPKEATFVKLLSAELEIKPDMVAMDKYPFPPTLYLYYRDIGDNISGPANNSDGSATQDGELYIDKLYAKDTRYTFSVLDYVTNEISANTFSTRSLLPLSAVNFTRLVAGTTSNKTYPTKLTIAILAYQK